MFRFRDWTFICPLTYRCVGDRRSRRAVWFGVLIGWLVVCRAPAAVARDLDYLREIQPILAEHCAHCHGIDQQGRQANLRLDVREAALRGGDSGSPAIVPGAPDKSEIVARIHATDPDEVMPPPDAKKPLSVAQKELLSTWIAQGANYSAHWAFTPPVRPVVDSTLAAHPLDALVRARQAELQLTAASPADATTLCRRVYLDLIGLPPSPAEVVAFQQDGLAATVDRLMQSERYGEKWARHWLDVARYSDTNGYEKDLRRDQWIWRDWVIQAFNRDMSYQQFLIEQIAGDLLPNATQEQRIATGFLRNSMLNEEGAIVPEQFRMFEMFDRMDCIGKGVLGLTTQCAQCHSHKFDPLSKDEYYGMFAFLNETYEAQSWVYSDEQQGELAKIRAELAAIDQQVRDKHPEWEQALTQWSETLRSQSPVWEPIVATEMDSVSGLNHPVQQRDRSILMLGHTSSDIFVLAKPAAQGVTGICFEALPHGDLPMRGPGRAGGGTFDVLEFEVWVQRPGAEAWEKLKLVAPTADYSSPDVRDADGKKARGPVAYLIDGTDDTAWRSDRGIGQRNQASVAVMQFEAPLDLPEGTTFKFVWRMSEMLGCARISLTRSEKPTAPVAPQGVMLALMKEADQRTPADDEAIFRAWSATLADFAPLAAQRDAIWARFPTGYTSVLHLAQRDPVYRRGTAVLDRGEWDRPLHEVEPGVPTALHPLEPEAGRDRVAFARWLASERSPLTARVAVNRVWQALFGEGLVETSEDFGTRAPVPEHLAVLDWLAMEFMEHGWSHKHLLRTIVTSQTYQQSSHATPESLERDPRNRYLTRGPRFRADAEVVRDMALSVAGILHHRVGGPPVIPPVPQNVLDYNYVYPSYWTPTEGAERYRRAVYGFRKRSMPDPVMSNLDGPNGDLACVRRVRSNTPLAALTGLNETIFVEAARAMALRVLREGGASDGERAKYAFCLCTARMPTSQEHDEILRLVASRRQKVAEGWLNPRMITTGQSDQLPSLPPSTTPQDAATWTLVSRVLLNLDETLCKN